MSPLPAGDLPQKPNSSTCRERGFLRSLALLLGPVALRLEDCATRARKFTATLAVPQPDAVQCEAGFARCRTLVAQGRKSNFGANAASATGGTAAGTAVATTAAGSAVGASISRAMGGSGATAGGAAIAVAAPIVSALGGFGFPSCYGPATKKVCKTRWCCACRIRTLKSPLACHEEIEKALRNYRRAQPSAAESIAVAAPFKA